MKGPASRDSAESGDQESPTESTVRKEASAEDLKAAAAIAVAGLATTGIDMLAMDGAMGMLGLVVATTAVAATANNETAMGRGLLAMGEVATGVLDATLGSHKAKKAEVQQATTENDDAARMASIQELKREGAAVVARRAEMQTGAFEAPSSTLTLTTPNDRTEGTQPVSEDVMPAIERVRDACRHLDEQWDVVVAARRAVIDLEAEAAEAATESDAAASALSELRRQQVAAAAAAVDVEYQCECQADVLTKAEASAAATLSALRASQADLLTLSAGELELGSATSDEAIPAIERVRDACRGFDERWEALLASQTTMLDAEREARNQAAEAAMESDAATSVLNELRRQQAAANAATEEYERRCSCQADVVAKAEALAATALSELQAAQAELASQMAKAGEGLSSTTAQRPALAARQQRSPPGASIAASVRRPKATIEAKPATETYTDLGLRRVPMRASTVAAEDAAAEAEAAEAAAAEAAAVEAAAAEAAEAEAAAAAEVAAAEAEAAEAEAAAAEAEAAAAEAEAAAAEAAAAAEVEEAAAVAAAAAKAEAEIAAANAEAEAEAEALAVATEAAVAKALEESRSTARVVAAKALEESRAEAGVAAARAMEAAAAVAEAEAAEAMEVARAAAAEAAEAVEAAEAATVAAFADTVTGVARPAQGSSSVPAPVSVPGPVPVPAAAMPRVRMPSRASTLEAAMGATMHTEASLRPSGVWAVVKQRVPGTFPPALRQLDARVSLDRLLRDFPEAERAEYVVDADGRRLTVCLVFPHGTHPTSTTYSGSGRGCVLEPLLGPIEPDGQRGWRVLSYTRVQAAASRRASAMSQSRCGPSDALATSPARSTAFEQPLWPKTL